MPLAVPRPLVFAAAAVLGAPLVHAQRAVTLPADTTVPVRVMLAGDVQLIRTGGRNVVVAPGREGVLLVDADEAARAAALDSIVRSARIGRVRRVVYSHHHDDASGGGVWFYNRGAEVLSSVVARDRLAKRRDENGALAVPDALPDRTFAFAFRFKWGADEIELRPLRSAHTDGDILAWFRPANVVHVGGLVRGDGYPLPDLEGGGTLAGTLAELETLLEECDDRTIIVPTHGPLFDKRTLREYAAMLAAVRTRVQVQVRAGRSEDEIATSGLTGDFEPRWGRGAISAERFLRQVVREASSLRR